MPLYFLLLRDTYVREKGIFVRELSDNLKLTSYDIKDLLSLIYFGS